MANIGHWLEQIRRAIYGREVRSSIADAIEAINKKQDNLDGSFNQLIINAGNSNAEIVDARVEANGTQHNTLSERLNKADADFDLLNKEVIDARTDIKNFAHPNLKARLDETDKNVEKNTKNIKSIIQVSILDYEHLVQGDDWSTAIETAIADNTKGEIFIPKGEYNFSRPIILGDDNSLKIDIGATIKATAEMDIFIQRHGTLLNLTREYNFYNRIYGHGVIDCNQKAKTGISLCGYRGYSLTDLTILDAVNNFIVTKGVPNGYAVELIAKDLKLENRIGNNTLNTTGILVNSTDNHFEDIIMVDIDTGIKCENNANSNRFFRCHHWMRNNRRIDAPGKCKSFVDYGLCNSFNTCYADTANVGFEFTGGGSYTNCAMFNSQHFVAVNAIGFKQIGTPNYVTSFTDCTVQSDTGAGQVEKAWDGTINDKLKFSNCRTYGIVPTGFPHNPRYEADTYWGRKVEVTGTVQTPWINWAQNQAMTCNTDNIITLNGNVIPKFIATAPLTSNSPGKNGEICYDNTYFYIWHADLRKWGRILFDFNF